MEKARITSRWNKLVAALMCLSTLPSAVMAGGDCCVPVVARRRSNNIKYYIWASINVIVLSFTSQGFIQTFFPEIGFSSRQIGTYASLISVVQIVVMIFSVFLRIM